MKRSMILTLKFYSATEFPSQIWDVNYLKRPEVYEKILIGTANKPTSNLFQPILQSNI